MKIGIVYGTRRTGATKEIVSWMTSAFESAGHTVAAAGPDQFDQFDCHLYLLGTAVYAFSAGRAGIPRFIRKNSARISERPTAVFIVCGADPLEAGSPEADRLEADRQKTNTTEGWLKQTLKKIFLNRDKYMASITNLLRTRPVETAFFKGFQEPEDREKTAFDAQRNEVDRWCSAVLAASENAPAR